MTTLLDKFDAFATRKDTTENPWIWYLRGYQRGYQRSMLNLWYCWQWSDIEFGIGFCTNVFPEWNPKVKKNVWYRTSNLSFHLGPFHFGLSSETVANEPIPEPDDE